MKRLIAVVLLCLTSLVHAQSPGWTKVSENKNAAYYIANGSFKAFTLNNGTSMYGVRGRMSSKDGKTTYEIYTVTAQDCKDGWGKLWSSDMDGKNSYSNDFAFDGPTTADTIASVICYVAQKSNSPATSSGSTM